MDLSDASQACAAAVRCFDVTLLIPLNEVPLSVHISESSGALPGLMRFAMLVAINIPAVPASAAPAAVPRPAAAPAEMALVTAPTVAAPPARSPTTVPA